MTTALVENITSWDNAAVGSGNVVNEVLRQYNDFGQVTKSYQSHPGAVNTSTTPNVRYGYADGSENTVRPTSLTYPDGRVLTYSYSGAANDRASRVDAIQDGSLTLAEYIYLGNGSVVEVDYHQPQVRYTLVGTAGGNDPDTGDIYRGLDRFGRVKDSYWRNYGSSVDVDRIKYGYDRAGNRIWRENVVAASLLKPFDELYAHDGLHRLKDMQRGTLSSQHSTLSLEEIGQAGMPPCDSHSSRTAPRTSATTSRASPPRSSCRGLTAISTGTAWGATPKGRRRS
jgi:hypothetical protein